MRNPTTWEEATQDVAVGLPSWREGAELTLDDVLQDIEEVLDEMRSGVRDEHGVPESSSSFRYLAWLGAVGYVLEKWYPNGDQLSHDFVRRCDDAVRSVLVLLPKKQHDYGPDNILWGGVQGVVVRAHDKLARIKNLRKREAMRREYDATRLPTYAPTPPAQNEPLADSYFDLIGYGIVGAMLVKGTFQLPLEADLERSAPLPYVHALTEKQQAEVREIIWDEHQKRERATWLR